MKTKSMQIKWIEMQNVCNMNLNTYKMIVVFCDKKGQTEKVMDLKK